MGLRGNELISDCSIELTIGRRYGLIGQNGCGKSNFLQCLASREVRYIMLWLVWCGCVCLFDDLMTGWSDSLDGLLVLQCLANREVRTVWGMFLLCGFVRVCSKGQSRVLLLVVLLCLGKWGAGLGSWYGCFSLFVEAAFFFVLWLFASAVF